MTILKHVLAGYDCWDLPYPGAPELMGRGLRRRNLAHVLAIKEARIAHLRSALPEIEMHIAALLDPAVHPHDAVQALDRWWTETGLQLSLFPPVGGRLKRFLFRGRYFADTPAAAQTQWYMWSDHPLVAPLDALLRDMALLIGEAIILRRPDFNWAVSEGRYLRQTQPTLFGRVALLHLEKLGGPCQWFDLFALARESYAELHNRKQSPLNSRTVGKAGGDGAGTFVGWTAVKIVNGEFTDDHFPHGRNGQAVAGLWP